MARILIVDDHSPARSLIRAIVRLDGHECVEASDGEEALADMAAEQFDLVLLDLIMPGIDGYQVLERLRAMPERAQTPVIVVSSADETVDLLRTAELGALDHLSKPFGYDEMERSIKRVLLATPEEMQEMIDIRTTSAESYHEVIDLVDEAKSSARRGLFRRARVARR